MKRFCTIEIITILMSFLLMINHCPLLANGLMFGSIIIMHLVYQTKGLLKVLCKSCGLYAIMFVFAQYGELNTLYEGLNLLLLLLSLHLMLVQDYLNQFVNITEAFKPFLIFVVFTLVMLSLAVFLKDVTLFNLVYPKGMTSILILILLMCMPYLLTMTCSFLTHD